MYLPAIFGRVYFHVLYLFFSHDDDFSANLDGLALNVPLNVLQNIRDEKFPLSRDFHKMASVRGFLPLARRLLRFQVNASSAYSISFTAKYSVKSKSRFHVFDQMESIWTSQQLLFISTSAKDTLLYSTNEANGGFRRGGPTELIFEPPDEHSGYMQPQPGETSADQAKHKLRKHPTRCFGFTWNEFDEISYSGTSVIRHLCNPTFSSIRPSYEEHSPYRSVV